MPDMFWQPYHGANVDADGFQIVESSSPTLYGEYGTQMPPSRPTGACGSLLQLPCARPHCRSVSLLVPLHMLSGYRPSGQGVQAWSFDVMQTRPFADVQAFILGGASP